MTDLNRRKLGLGFATSVVAIPAAAMASMNPAERVRYHTEHLSKAMRDLYGKSVELVEHHGSDCVPFVMVAANDRVPLKKEHSNWVYVGPNNDDWMLS